MSTSLRVWCLDCGSSSLRLAEVVIPSGGPSTCPDAAVRILGRQPVVWRGTEIGLAAVLAGCAALLEDAAAVEALPDAVAVTAVFSWVGLDGRGQPVTDAITYRDRRGSGYLDALAAAVPDFARRSGRPASAELLAPIDRAFGSDRPVRYTTLKDAIVASLCGRDAESPVSPGIDAVQAAYSGLLREDREWQRDNAVLSWLGRSDLPFSAPQPPASVAGTWGFGGHRITVIRGTSDGSAGFYGGLAGGADGRTLALTSGTTEVMMIAGPSGEAGTTARDDSTTPTVNPIDPRARRFGTRVWGVSTGTVGGFLNWFDRSLGSALTGRAVGAGVAPAPGSDGLMVFPALDGEREPRSIPGVAASLVGLRTYHGPEHIVRATGEAAAYRLAEVLETLARRGIVVDRVIAGGGGATPVWNAIRASVCGVPVAPLPWVEASVVGSAWLARLALTDETSPIGRPGAAVVPDPAEHAAYRRLRQSYRATAVRMHDPSEV